MMYLHAHFLDLLSSPRLIYLLLGLRSMLTFSQVICALFSYHYRSNFVGYATDKITLVVVILVHNFTKRIHHVLITKSKTSEISEISEIIST